MAGLTAKEIQGITEPGRHRDSEGLYLVMTPPGTKPESTEGGRRVSVLKRQEGAPVLLG